jgi:hypothetical protein
MEKIMKTSKQNTSLVLIALCLLVLAGCASDSGTIPDWTAVEFPPFNMSDPAEITNPVLTAADVTDRDADFLADPFLFFENGRWYMFFEIYAADPGYAEIALAMSDDGLHWTYDRVVLSPGYHHTYPYVLKYEDDYYMFPETYTAEEVRVYKAANFPYGWKHVSTIAEGRPFVDPTVFRYNDMWWMFVGSTNQDCYLYYSDELTSGWVEHRKNPIISNDLSKARPAGRAFVFDGGRIIRLGQKCDVMYGEKVRAFEVDLLTKTEYIEHEIPESPILEADGTGWNAINMHQLDPWWDGEKWIIAVDANQGKKGYSIGIYTAEKD